MSPNAGTEITASREIINVSSKRVLRGGLGTNTAGGDAKEREPPIIIREAHADHVSRAERWSARGTVLHEYKILHRPEHERRRQKVP